MRHRVARALDDRVIEQMLFNLPSGRRPTGCRSGLHGI